MTKSFAGVSSLALGLTLTILPGAAHAGFLEQLFGVSPQSAPQQAPSSSFRENESSYYQDAPVHHRAKRKVIADGKPKLQKPTDLMHDVTLQPGDAVMMKDGINIYMGDESERHHAAADFAPLDAVDNLPRQEVKSLAAIDTTRNDPLRGTLKPDNIASGRSAAVANSIVSGHEIVDAGGKKVRYVGP